MGAQVIAAYKELDALSDGIGLQVQSTKSAAYSRNSEAHLAVAEELNVTFVSSKEGIMVAGMPDCNQAAASHITLFIQLLENMITNHCSVLKV